MINFNPTLGSIKYTNVKSVFENDIKNIIDKYNDSFNKKFNEIVANISNELSSNFGSKVEEFLNRSLSNILSTNEPIKYEDNKSLVKSISKENIEAALLKHIIEERTNSYHDLIYSNHSSEIQQFTDYCKKYISDNDWSFYSNDDYLRELKDKKDNTKTPIIIGLKFNLDINNSYTYFYFLTLLHENDKLKDELKTKLKIIYDIKEVDDILDNNNFLIIPSDSIKTNQIFKNKILYIKPEPFSLDYDRIICLIEKFNDDDTKIDYKDEFNKAKQIIKILKTINEGNKNSLDNLQKVEMHYDKINLAKQMIFKNELGNKDIMTQTGLSEHSVVGLRVRLNKETKSDVETKRELARDALIEGKDIFEVAKWIKLDIEQVKEIYEEISTK